MREPKARSWAKVVLAISTLVAVAVFAMRRDLFMVGMFGAVGAIGEVALARWPEKPSG